MAEQNGKSIPGRILPAIDPHKWEPDPKATQDALMGKVELSAADPTPRPGDAGYGPRRD